jgi:hypothetical protein
MNFSKRLATLLLIRAGKLPREILGLKKKEIQTPRGGEQIMEKNKSFFPQIAK